MLAVGNVVRATRRQIIAGLLTCQPHRVHRILVVGHIHQRTSAVRQQDAAVVVHHMGQARDKDFIVWSEQALRTQYRKTGLRVGLCQQRNHIFASRFTAGEFIGKALGAEVLFDIPMVVIIKIERR